MKKREKVGYPKHNPRAYAVASKGLFHFEQKSQVYIRLGDLLLVMQNTDSVLETNI